MSTLGFDKKVVGHSLVLAFLALIAGALLKFGPTSDTSRNKIAERSGAEKARPTTNLPARSISLASTAIPGLSERARFLRSELLRNPVSAWNMLNDYRGEGVDSETISLITAAVFWDDTEGIAEAISSWPNSKNPSAWKGCMRNAMEQAKEGKAPAEVLKAIKLIPPHHAASDFVHGNFPEAFLAAGFEPDLILRSIASPGSVNEPQLKSLYLKSLGQNPEFWAIPFEKIPPDAMADFVDGRAREGIMPTTKWLAEGFAKQPEAREPLRQAVASAISLDAARAYAALVQVKDPIFESIVLAEMARAALVENSLEVANQWAGKITDRDLKAELMKEFPAPTTADEDSKSR